MLFNSQDVDLTAPEGEDQQDSAEEVRSPADDIPTILFTDAGEMEHLKKKRKLELQLLQSQIEREHAMKEAALVEAAAAKARLEAENMRRAAAKADLEAALAKAKYYTEKK